MTLPLTITLTTYNRAAWVEKAIEGILAQTYTDFELLIMDRGSSDATPEVILGFKDPRIRYVRNPPGTSRAFNGISTVVIARGEYLLVAHDDDIFLPDLAKRQMEMLTANPGMTGVGANMQLMNEDGADVGTTMYPVTGDRIYGPGEYVRNVLEDRIWILICGFMYRRRMIPDAAIQELYYGVVRKKKSKETRDATSEMNLLTYLNRKGSLGFIGEPLIRYRQHSGQDCRSYDVFKPVQDVVSGLKAAARHNAMGPEVMGVLEAFLFRYRAQAFAGQLRDAKPPAAALCKLRNWQPKIEALAQDLASRNALLPVGILMSHLGLKEDSGIWTRGAELRGGWMNIATVGLMGWLQARLDGRNVFDARPGYRRIAIFGSVFIAALLILEAQAKGIEVAACLDTNLLRQGDRLLGVPILAPEWLVEQGAGLDAVVISSEKDHLNLFTTILVKAGATGEIVSWLDLIPGTRTEAPADCAVGS